MKKVLFILTSASLAIGGGAFAAARYSDKTPMKAVGEPLDCVQTHRIQSTKIIDDQTIDFKMSGGKILRNTLPNSCPSLKSNDSFSYHSSTGSLCSVDIIRVLQTYGGRIEEGAGCGLGKFQPVEPAAG